MEGLRCILHAAAEKADKSTVTVKRLDQRTWNKIKESAQKRMSKPKAKASKYWTICRQLPENYSENDGYHSECYKTFTALPTDKSRKSPEKPSVKAVLRKDVSHPSTSAGVFQNTCIFCDKERKTQNRQESRLSRCELDSPEENIKQAAITLRDTVMQAKIGSIGFHSKEVKYHNTCKRQYLNRANKVTQQEKEKPMESEKTQEALDYIMKYIKASVVECEQPEFLTSIQTRFNRYFNSITTTDTYSPYSSTFRFKEKLKSFFGKEVNIDKISKKQGLVVYKAGIRKEEALQRAKYFSSTEEFHVIEAALQLRAAVLNLKSSLLKSPCPVTIDNIHVGQVDTPSILSKFFQVLYAGKQDNLAEDTNRHVESSSHDVIYIVTKGQVKPLKQVCMGIGIKSMTGSKKIVEILNHFGHSIGYHVAEEMETDLAIETSEKQKTTPHGTLLTNSLATGLAWDNYDELVETLSGKGTLHDTVGICYQNTISVDKTQICNTTNIERGNDESEVQMELGQDNIQTNRENTHENEGHLEDETPLGSTQKSEEAVVIDSSTDMTEDKVDEVGQLEDGNGIGLNVGPTEAVEKNVDGFENGTPPENVGNVHQSQLITKRKSTSSETDCNATARKSRKKRKLDTSILSIEPVRGKPIVKPFSYEKQENDDPPNLVQMQRRDTLWVMSCAFQENTPMWRGWNSLVTEDKLPIQKVHYMENIPLPPTRLDVVRETMKRSQQVAKECNQEIVIVHYDLAIAKPALQIQSNEAPRFDDIFVCFGPFHIEMTYFACLGYYIDGSGGPQILSDSEVLAEGSLNGFLSGKNFNRCKRIHPLLATAVETLLLRKFISQDESIPEEFFQRLSNFQKNKDPKSLDELEQSSIFTKVMERYEQFAEDTRNGKHGATAKYWMGYVDLVKIYLLFDRACRTNDVALFMYALGRMYPIFFATHRPNYARWMVRYHMNLLNMSQQVRHMLQNGALSIRRTPKNFSRSAVDLTLEQTINRDAASRHTGIAAFTNNESARRRWMITRPIRAKIVGSLLECAGMRHREEVSQELYASRIERDNTDLNKIIGGFEGTLNPFDASCNNNKLYCVTSGRASSAEVASELLHFEETGTNWSRAFVDECNENPERFQKPIRRRKVKNFANDSVKMKVKTRNLKEKEVRCTRDLFGRLLFLATKQNIDLQMLLTYPLIGVPISLCHYDGNMNKTKKSSIMDKLESKSQPEVNQVHKNDVYLIDAMFFFRTLPVLPASFDGVAKVIMEKACSFDAPTIHLICDRYVQYPTIKDLERASRGDHDGSFIIKGPEQKRPVDFMSALLSSSFKTAVLGFLADEWQKDKYTNVLMSHSFYYAVGKICYKFQVIDGKMSRTVAEDLASNHLEADTRILFHARYVSEHLQGPSTVTVRASDTDVFILLMHHAARLSASIFMDVGLSSKNTRRAINISKLASEYGPAICSALPGFHAFTGSDYTAAFFGKGKVRPYELMVKNDKFTEAFGHLGESATVSESTSDTLEEFVCAMYGQAKLQHVDKARFIIFGKLYAPKNAENPLERIKTSDPSCLPPCKSVLHQKIERANYVSVMWRNATMANPVDYAPENKGWKLSDDRDTLSIVWYSGQTCPQTCVLEADDLQSENEDEDDDLYESEED